MCIPSLILYSFLAVLYECVCVCVIVCVLFVLLLVFVFVCCFGTAYRYHTVLWYCHFKNRTYRVTYIESLWKWRHWFDFILHSCTCQNFIFVQDFVYWYELYCEQCHMLRSWGFVFHRKGLSFLPLSLFLFIFFFFSCCPASWFYRKLALLEWVWLCVSFSDHKWEPCALHITF